MKQDVKPYIIKFEGYTWDEYFYVIANKSGILVAYRGGLDNEGAVKLDEIIYVGEADELSALYESKQFTEARKTISKKDRLFFSYAEIGKKDRADITRVIRDSLMSCSVNENKIPNVKLFCKGACALFPKKILQRL